MKSICFFSSYFNKEKIPYYVKCYLTELTRHFDEIVFITNKKSITENEKLFLSKNKIALMLVSNEGYDFGMWQKGFNTYPIENYDRVGLVNDSCILFKRLDNVFESINKSSWDYCGILDSSQIAYHVQSYFVIINKSAIKFVESYFRENGLKENFSETIRTYEVGITEYLKSNNLTIGSVFRHENFCADELNPAFSGLQKLLRHNFPMIKKKIIFGNYRNGEASYLSSIGFNFNANNYIKLIKASGTNLILNFRLLNGDYNYFSTRLKLILLRLFSKMYFPLRMLYHKLGFSKLK